MSTTFYYAAALLLLTSCNALPNAALSAVPLDAKGLTKRAGTDCGTFTMFCDKAAGACNNACFHIYCVDNNEESRKMVYNGDDDNKNKINRQQSGCETNDKAVCNSFPFSQKLHDPINRTPGDTSVNCDEWPMALTKQEEYDDGEYRNSLRCIPGSENFSGGGQVQQFILGNNQRGDKKTCDKEIEEGDYWNIEFDLTGTNDRDVAHCINKKEHCKEDSAAFHMTKYTGSLKHPNRPDQDNHYSLGLGEPDLQQCRVTVHTHGYETDATVYDPDGNNKGSENGRLDQNDSSLTVKGLPSDLRIDRGDGDDWDQHLSFNYGPRTFAEGMEDLASGALGGFRYYQWAADTTGSSTQIDAQGHYCTRDENGGNEAVLTCYFPCVMPEN